ncbi:MAG: chemotaxis protein [Sedimenticola sp.]|uniref:Chemotaxis protein CheV n=1 Tax=Sedimenticola thiotaurini TaxID=1543721 RepID=A0A558CY62_9GAMM|nr:chemotaxis protein [Sedimenticola sp.]MCW8920332.1 chemotaxis protein [Sedimenticola sp.]MCW8949775.1 chemotaxis protein [Sedimenticola sp.]TVT53706.1 MAG: chemotaxis protein CheV [Sedimenticola thiotaurini]
MLLFKLFGRQTFGINVLKIKEIIPYHTMNTLPGSHAAVIGIAQLRGQPFPVIDLAKAMNMSFNSSTEDLQTCPIIISEFNRSLQGFLVKNVDQIISLDWGAIQPPPSTAGRFNYITGVINRENTIIEVVDVERVLNEVAPPKDSTGRGIDLTTEELDALRKKLVLIVDDSALARKQILQTLAMIGIEPLIAKDGKEALDYLHSLQLEGRRVDLIVSDIEMPEMDGYTLTREIRKDEDLSSVYILLHTSLAGAVSQEYAATSGANAALTKFVTEELADAVLLGLSDAREE